MKIGVMTRRYGYNYGSSLQAFAVRYVLESLGHEVKVLNYDEFSQHPVWYIKPIILKAIYLFVRIFMNSSRLGKQFNDDKELIARFNNFDRQFIKPSTRKLRFGRQLKEEINDAECVICGSDQIWNPILFDKHFFLDFVDGSLKKKIAFATSFGVSVIETKREQIKNYLVDFSYISVREKQGACILDDLLGPSCYPVLLDPTMLVDKNLWARIQKPHHIPNKYIFCYFLGTKIPHEYIKNFSKKHKCLVLNITSVTTRNCIEGIQERHLSPEQFLYTLNHAECILTDSFHASVFSVLFHKPFYIFNKFDNSSSKSQNSRIVTLVEKLNLGQCYINDMKDIKYDMPFIDYEHTDALLSQLKSNSLQSLRSALS